MKSMMQRFAGMGRYLPVQVAADPFNEPPAPSAGKVGVLLVNLGTPDAPEKGAIRRFLGEFLSDPRVVEIPRAAWLPILNGVILNTRPGKIQDKYASVWMPEGSPLMVWSRRQTQAVRDQLRVRGMDAEIELGMRYGEPSLAGTIDELRRRGCRRILVLPLYPQYAASTTATVVDKIAAHAARLRDQPEFRFVQRFYDDPGYIDALARRVHESWQAQGRGQVLIMSFHGLPKRSVQLGDPYYAECLATGRLLARRLELTDDQYVVTFQSRFGAAEWLQPYTEPTIEQLARQGITEVDVVCPGFAADCLETLEEIAQGCEETFLHAGGRTLRYIPALNDSKPWIEALTDLVERNLLGWVSSRR